jgi:hypothetical protein
MAGFLSTKDLVARTLALFEKLSTKTLVDGLEALSLKKNAHQSVRAN